MLMGTPENASLWRSDQCFCSLVCCVAPGRLSHAPCPASPRGLSWDRGTASGTVYVGCTQAGEGSGQHPPAPTASAAPKQPGRKGTLKRSQGQWGKRGNPPAHTDCPPQRSAKGLSPGLAAAGGTWEAPRSGSGSARGSRVVLGICTAGSRPLRGEAAVWFPKRCQVQRVPAFGVGHLSLSASIHPPVLPMPEHRGCPPE